MGRARRGGGCRIMCRMPRSTHISRLALAGRGILLYNSARRTPPPSPLIQVSTSFAQGIGVTRLVLVLGARARVNLARVKGLEDLLHCSVA